MPSLFSINFAAAAKSSCMTQNNFSKILFYHLAQSATQEQAPPCHIQLQMHSVKPQTVQIKREKRQTKFIYKCYIIHIAYCNTEMKMPTNTLSKTKQLPKNPL